jgi:hypothetical protein
LSQKKKKGRKEGRKGKEGKKERKKEKLHTFLDIPSILCLLSTDTVV